MWKSGQFPETEHMRIAEKGQNKNGHSWGHKWSLTSMYRKAKAK